MCCSFWPPYVQQMVATWWLLQGHSKSVSSPTKMLWALFLRQIVIFWLIFGLLSRIRSVNKEHSGFASSIHSLTSVIATLLDSGHNMPRNCQLHVFLHRKANGTNSTFGFVDEQSNGAPFKTTNSAFNFQYYLFK